MTSEESAAAPSPADRIGEMLDGFQKTQALYVAAKLGIADVLHDRARTSDEIAQAVGAHEPSLRRLLGYLVSLGVLTRDDAGTFANTAVGELLRKDHPESEYPWAVLLGSPLIWRPWGDLYNAVATGRPAFEQVFGEQFFEFLGNNAPDAEAFNAAMSSSSRSVSAILDAYDFSSFGKIVDVGGGQGAFLCSILDRYPDATGIVFDLPSVGADTSAVEQPTVAGRCEFIGGDMFQSVPTGGDAYLLKRIIHDWSDAEAITILRNCREAMHEQGKILLVERVVQPSATNDPATSTDLMMLVLVSGRERTEADFRELLTAAGFTMTRVVPVGGLSIVEGIPSQHSS